MFQPFSDRVLVERHEEASGTPASGLSIPDAAKDKPQEGTVVAVGPGHLDTGILTPLQCAAGDHVLFAKFAGVEVNIDGKKLLIMHESELLGRLIPAPGSLTPMTREEMKRPKEARVG